VITKLKGLLNSLRNLLLFRVCYPWVTYGKNVHVQWSACFASPYRNISIGNNVGIGPHCVIMSDLIIGNDVLIAPHVALLSRYPHRTDLVGTSMFQGPRADRGEIVIEEDVWIGFGVIVFSGVRIGRGSIIAAGSVVLRDVPRYSILLPKQEHILKPRFSSHQIDMHEAGLERAGVIPHQTDNFVATGRDL
jgi:acetyltransferase-like isoleucine patch superfamily enzyme